MKRKINQDTGIAAPLKPPTGHENHQFIKQLAKQVPPILIDNTVDDEPPPDDFEIINKYEFCKGTTPLDPNARYGCDCKGTTCDKSCDCLADCGSDQYGQPLGFPYKISGENKGCLRSRYLAHRHVIYECNELCGCDETCGNKVVQKGRTETLEIFKTQKRGWGELDPTETITILIIYVRASVSHRSTPRSISRCLLWRSHHRS